jgi:hypothetical protein
MSGERILEGLQPVLQAAGSIPPQFLSGLLSGLVFGVLLTTLVLQRRGVRSIMWRSTRAVFVLAPAFLASLLWGLWFGILAAKQMLH